MKRRIVSAVAAIALVALITPSASAQTGFGVRYANLTPEGDYIEMDATSAVGVHVALGFLPLIKLQIGAEAILGGTATYDYDVPGVAAKEDDFKSLGLFADVRYPISLIPLFPVKPVVGGGMNMSVMTYLDKEAFLAGEVTDDVESLMQTGYHLMFGLLIKPPFLPFTITAEYRMQTVKLTDDTVKSNGILLGLTFGF